MKKALAALLTVATLASAGAVTAASSDDAFRFDTREYTHFITIDNYNAWYTIDANSGDKISYGDGELNDRQTLNIGQNHTFGLKGPDVPFTWQKNCGNAFGKETTTFNQLKPHANAYGKGDTNHIRVTFGGTCFGVAQYAGWADSR